MMPPPRRSRNSTNISWRNGSLGTDHGASHVQSGAGGNVNGGVHNWRRWRHEIRRTFGIDGHYLPHRTDYRALFWEILRDHMGANPATVDTVFPGYTSAGLLRTEPVHVIGLPHGNASADRDVERAAGLLVAGAHSSEWRSADRPSGLTLS
ncbi:MAG: hypothetical protein U0V87_03780 [Acidobacteriota bacterium]